MTIPGASWAPGCGPPSNGLLSLAAGERLGRPVEREPVVDVGAYPTPVTVTTTLHEPAARVGAEHRYPAEQEATAVSREVRDAVVEIRAAIAAARAREGR